MSHKEELEATKLALVKMTAERDALERVLMHHEARGAAEEPVGKGPHAITTLARFTLKQHAVLQMLLRGARNAEIAARLKVSESTVKTIVTGAMDKVGTNRRTHLASLMQPVMGAVNNATYEQVTTLPKDWDMKWTAKDRKVRPELYVRKHHA